MSWPLRSVSSCCTASIPPSPVSSGLSLVDGRLKPGPASSTPSRPAPATSSFNRSPPRGLKEVYFQDNGRRAGQLEEVRFTDIEHLEFDL